ncbi:hypothetical protein BKA62DRAFT_463969 [Auriculariales sp. MPI-PUGE-AT-0066]|nr:hypothetical protein BKA62DRAFT_463969 [Auriculariales sp. MPI-PUGE-AT-0066]
MVIVMKDLPASPPSESNQLSVHIEAEIQPQDAPPAYASSSSTSPRHVPDLLENQGLSRVQPPIAHCNSVAIKRSQGGLTGSFVIDPELVIPIEMLAPLKDGEERKNFLVDVGHNPVEIDAWVAPPQHTIDSKHPRTTIDLRGRNVRLRLHSSGNRPFGISASTAYQSTIQLELPRDFRGPLTIKSQSGQVKFSPALEPLVATFSDYDDLKKCFVGDFKALEFGQGAWEGSMVDIDAPYAKIRLRFVDEPEPQMPTSASSGWGIWPFSNSATSPKA